jgi:delta14-sterol reductase
MSLRGQGWSLFLWTKTHFADIALFSVFFSFLVSAFVYVHSFFGNKMLALGGNTGNPIYDVKYLLFVCFDLYVLTKSIYSL